MPKLVDRGPRELGAINGQHWLAALTKPGREIWAAENVMRQGFDYFLPRIVINQKLPGGLSRKSTACLFPGYLFVRSANGQWRFLLSTFGIRAVVSFGDFPAIVPKGIIDGLREASNGIGLIELPTRPKKLIKAGQTIQITRGVFAGKLGLWDGTPKGDRVKILLNILGSLTPIMIDPDYVEAMVPICCP